MHRFTKLGVATVAALALATPALTTAAEAAGSHSSAVAKPTVAEKKKAKAGKIKIKKSAKGVQPGIGKMKLTAIGVKGKVKFVVKGDAGKVKKSVKAKAGKAVFKVPPLGTGKYKVTATSKGKKPGKTKFEVYDSLLTVNSTTFTYSLASNNCYSQAPLTGSVKYKGKTATTGYADIYQDGKIKGGTSSPGYLSFAAVQSNGTFSKLGFICDVVDGAGNTDPKGPGTYSFNVYYTDGPEFADYISSNTIIVNITA